MYNRTQEILFSVKVLITYRIRYEIDIKDYSNTDLTHIGAIRYFSFQHFFMLFMFMALVMSLNMEIDVDNQGNGHENGQGHGQGHGQLQGHSSLGQDTFSKIQMSDIGYG
jgi:hypothetical protein